jgi:hypothetical protein
MPDVDVSTAADEEEALVVDRESAVGPLGVRFAVTVAVVVAVEEEDGDPSEVSQDDKSDGRFTRRSTLYTLITTPPNRRISVLVKDLG